MLRVIHRLAYEPGSEHVVARLMVPVREGLCEIACHAVDNETGTRESTLNTMRLKDDPEGIEKHPGQAFFDDAKHDRMFPQHALSRVRRAQRWLVDEGHVRVTDPPAPFMRGEVELPEARCSIVPPPRYLPLLKLTMLADIPSIP